MIVRVEPSVVLVAMVSPHTRDCALFTFGTIEFIEHRLYPYMTV